MMASPSTFLLLCTLSSGVLAFAPPSPAACCTEWQHQHLITKRAVGIVARHGVLTTSSSFALQQRSIMSSTTQSLHLPTTSCLRAASREENLKVDEVRPLEETANGENIEALQAVGEIADDEEEEEEDIELWEEDSKNVELLLLVAWGVSIIAFILINNFVGPWPMPQMEQVPERFWRATHVVSGMLFGGGIILTTAIEWLVASNRNPPVLQFWFDKVPLLDAAIVLPALTIAIISGTGCAIENYGGLGVAPVHIAITFYALVAFASWWAATDLTTQGKTLVEVNEWVITSTNDNTQEIPKIVKYRRISNIVSCLFVITLYTIMVLKPGVIYWKDLFQN